MLRIRELCARDGITQREAAKNLGIAPSTLSQYATGKASPDIDMLNQIADFFDVSVDYLIGRTDKVDAPESEPEPIIAPLLLPGYDELSPDDRLRVEGYVLALREKAIADRKSQIEAFRQQRTEMEDK